MTPKTPPKTLKIPRVIAMARYADIPNILKPKDIEAKLLSDIKNDDSRILFYLFENLEEKKQIICSQTDLFRLIYPEKNITQVAVSRLYKKVWALSGINFTLPKRVNNKGEVDLTSTTKLFDIMETNELKTDKRVTTVVILSKNNVMDYYTAQKKIDGKNSGFVRLNNLELIGKTLKLKNKQFDLFNRINDFLSYINETKLVNKKVYESDFDYFCDKIGVLKQLKKNKKEVTPRVKNLIETMIDNQILIKSYTLDEQRQVIKFDFI
jgi:hypothetical protein